MRHTRQGQRKLIQWLDRSGLTQRNLAKLLEISAPHLNQILSGDKTPGLALSARIDDVTGIAMRSWAESWVGESDDERAVGAVSGRKTRG